jgi:hypothetical protein
VSVHVTLNGFDYDERDTATGSFTYVLTPEVVSISPRSGWRNGGEELTLTTRNVYANAAQGSKIYCSFGSAGNFVLVEASVIDAVNQIVKCLSPRQRQDHAIQNDLPDRISVSLKYSSSPALHDTSGPLFTYTDAIVVDRISPSSGPRVGNTSISIYGENFENEHNLLCVFGAYELNLNSPAEFLSSNKISCTSPAHLTGDRTLTVTVSSTDQSVKTYRSLATFTFFDEPQVFSLSPPFGSRAGGTVVIVNGHNFDNRIGNSELAASNQILCRFGTESYATAGSYISPQQIKCVSPMASGSVKVGNPVTVEVSLNGGSDFTSNGLSYVYTSLLRLQSRTTPPPTAPPAMPT